jgi:RNA polymerase sigma factor (sigma-70 family)
MPSPSVVLLRTQSDERLAALAAAGHERAFEAIVERHRRQLLRHARRHLPEARAEDALQQAFVSAWTALRRGDEVRELRPWLHRIVHNSALNALRTPGYDYDELRATLEGSGGPAELAERRALVRSTLAGLAALPERQREALLRIAVEGRSQDEVAEQLGLSQGAVRQLAHRARTALRTAATALVPLPLATWLATAGAGRGDIAVRVGELVAGAGGGATLAKAGAVAALAGGAVAGPAVVHDVSERGQRPRAEASADARGTQARRAAEPASPAPAVRVAAIPPVAGSGGDDAHEGSGVGRGEVDRDDRSGSRDDDGDAAARDRRGRAGEGGRRGSGGVEDDSRSRGGDDEFGPDDNDETRGGGPRPGRDDDGRESDDDCDAGSRSGDYGSGSDDDDSGDDQSDDDEPDASHDDDSSSSGGEEPSSGDADMWRTRDGDADSEEADDTVVDPTPTPSATPSATPAPDDDGALED